MDATVEAPLFQWNKLAVQSDPECYNLHTKYAKWGTFIGCQSIEIFDVRNPRVYDFFSQSLNQQSCANALSGDGQRNYIRTGDQFLFIDKVTKHANVWYVPAGYFSDGVSTPDIIREILPGAILDTESPRTLSAALFHDRYFCLYDYTVIAWDKDRDNYPSHLRAIDKQLASINTGYGKASVPSAYRRRGCANTSFRDGLRTAGASSFVSTLFRRMVGIVNPGRIGYCPQLVHAPALAALDQQLNIMLEVGDFGDPVRTQVPGCRAKEPIILCLSNVEALWHFVGQSPDDYGDASSALIPDEWRQVFRRIMCFDIQAQIVSQDEWSQRYSFDRSLAIDLCSTIDLEGLIVENEDIRPAIAAQYSYYQQGYHPIESPFRAGDFFVEAALMLTRENGPEIFLQTVASARTIDYAILAITTWNQDYENNPAYQRVSARN